MKITTPDYRSLVKSIFDMIISEIENVTDLEMQYPKLILMYEFFRLLRGEAFISIRPEHDENLQKELYKLDDELFNKIKALKPDTFSGRGKDYYDNMISIGLRPTV